MTTASAITQLVRVAAGAALATLVGSAAGGAHIAVDETVTVRLWFVQFDPSVDTSQLPIDIRDLHQRIPEHTPLANGRIQTTGLARQMRIDELTLQIGPHRLAMREGALVSSSDEGAKGGAPWQVLSAPVVLLAIGQQGVVSVGQPVSYLARRDDGCLAVETDAGAVEGVEIALTAKRLNEEGARFEDIRIKFTRVAQRQPVEGVPFDVGRPVLDSRETSLGLTIKADRVGIIPLPQGDNEPPILVFLTAGRGESSTGER